MDHGSLYLLNQQVTGCHHPMTREYVSDVLIGHRAKRKLHPNSQTYYHTTLLSLTVCLFERSMSNRQIQCTNFKFAGLWPESRGKQTVSPSQSCNTSFPLPSSFESKLLPLVAVSLWCLAISTFVDNLFPRLVVHLQSSSLDIPSQFSSLCLCPYPWQ